VLRTLSRTASKRIEIARNLGRSGKVLAHRVGDRDTCPAMSANLHLARLIYADWAEERG
jgi:hypothetical protein